MSSEISRQDDQNASLAASAEVEFALVLSRMIDSVKNDPEHLRETIYELARHKLQEQFSHENVKDLRPLSNALEVAIQGVEAFSKKNDQAPDSLGKPALAEQRPLVLVEDQRQDAAPVAWLALPAYLNRDQVQDQVQDQKKDQVYEREEEPARSPKMTSAFSTLWRFAFLIVVVLAVGIAIRDRHVSLDQLRAKAIQIANLILAPAPSEAPAPQAASTQAASKAPAKPPSPLTPTAYGIYAVSDNKLYELELLPGRAPDIRVAISAAITTPSRTVLPDGHVKFLVYRRDSASSAADRADVRLIARVVRAVSFDESGKAVVAKSGDSWVIRNISLPFRSSPDKDDPDMYEVQSEDPDQALQPGRYALILKGQSYDFTVAGDVNDPRQCLERLAATNGQFYTECKKP